MNVNGLEVPMTPIEGDTYRMELTTTSPPIAWRPIISMAGCPNSFPPLAGESSSDYAARLVREGNASAWLAEREQWVMQQYREQITARFGASSAEQHLRRVNADAESFFAEIERADADAADR